MTKTLTLLRANTEFEAVGMEHRDGYWFIRTESADQKWIPLYEVKCDTNLIDMMNHEKIFQKEKV